MKDKRDCVLVEKRVTEMLRLSERMLSTVVRDKDYRPAVQTAMEDLSKIFCAEMVLAFEYDGEDFFLVAACSNGRLLKKPKKGMKSLARKRLLLRKDVLLKNGKKPKGLEGFRSVMVAPLLIRDRVLGAMLVADEDEKFDENDAEMFGDLCEEIALLMEHVKFLELIEKERERYAMLVENVPETVYSASAKNREFSFLSDEITQITGHAPESFIRQPSLQWECIHPDDRALVKKVFMEAKKKKKKFAVRYRIFDRNGTLHYVLDKAEPVFEGKKLVGFDGVIEDNTEHMNMLRHINETNTKLKLLLNDRSQLNEDLRHANELLEKEKEKLVFANEKLRGLDKLKDEFISIVTHEMKTPLFPIMGYVEELLENESLSQSQKRLLEVVSRNSKRLNSLVRDVLLISKLDAGRLKLRPEKVKVKELMRQACADFRKVAKDKGLKLSCRSDDVVVQMDRERITQVLSNFISNAIKYTEKGTVRVSAKKRDGCVTFEVSDSGPGIPKESMEHMFEKFFRVESTSGKEGSGLGLAISKALVEAHGGEIGVKSKQGRGSCFFFTLPKIFKGELGIEKDDLLREKTRPLERVHAVGYE